MATKDPRYADEISRIEDLDEALQVLLALPYEVDPFGFDVNQERLEEARPLGIGKPERKLVSSILYFYFFLPELMSFPDLTSPKTCLEG